MYNVNMKNGSWNKVVQATKGLIPRRNEMIEVNASAVDDGNIDVADINTDMAPPSEWYPEEANLNDEEVRDEDVDADE